MKKNLIKIMFFLFAPLAVFAMDSPAPQGTVTKNFGLSSGGLPQMGITFSIPSDSEAEKNMFTAADDGEIFFTRGENETSSRLPSPLGAWTAVEHNNGMIGIYSRFEKTAFSFSSPYAHEVMPVFVEKGKPLFGESGGEAGISGWANQSGVYFQVFDRAQRSWINPAALINPPARAPAIVNVSLRDAQGNIIELPRTAGITQGAYTVLVHAISGAAASPLAPFKIIVSLNGSETGTLALEAFSAQNGIFQMNRGGAIPLRQVYSASPRYEAATAQLIRGLANLEIIVQDISGQTRTANYRFPVE